ncbi:MAG TPA: type IV pilus modification protein PilV [Methyloprofundus sp.]|uniref:type IV pilus modification protein PilV n=1 Tax=Methyloprofundus sp. TaxID=2020875 RepID=UPI001793CF18|nr:type IV pilus modification protein PilV [Methyloprofundus sp.]HIG65418.1 type IV pilus modification protein PilV [Methyloprofundus sp.]HIL78235.1 type IV pilus modification protein PilV [Methylococcales bacterium]
MSNNQGFTLIEVLIAVVVLAVGLLGLAGLQTTSLKHNQTAYFRSQATQMAYDMADRIRANHDEAKLGGASTYVVGNATAHAGCSTLVGCTATEMAENDLFEWIATLQAALPGVNAVGTVTYNAALSLFSIQVQWDDNRDNNIDDADPSFQTDFQL